jgi:hypothetical protein
VFPASKRWSALGEVPRNIVGNVSGVGQRCRSPTPTLDNPVEEGCTFNGPGSNQRSGPSPHRGLSQKPGADDKPPYAGLLPSAHMISSVLRWFGVWWLRQSGLDVIRTHPQPGIGNNMTQRPRFLLGVPILKVNRPTQKGWLLSVSSSRPHSQGCAPVTKGTSARPPCSRRHGYAQQHAQPPLNPSVAPPLPSLLPSFDLWSFSVLFFQNERARGALCVTKVAPPLPPTDCLSFLFFLLGRETFPFCSSYSPDMN